MEGEEPNLAERTLGEFRGENPDETGETSKIRIN